MESGERGGADRGRSGALGACSAPLSRLGGALEGSDYFIAGRGMQREIGASGGDQRGPEDVALTNEFK